MLYFPVMTKSVKNWYGSADWKSVRLLWFHETFICDRSRELSGVTGRLLGVWNLLCTHRHNYDNGIIRQCTIVLYRVFLHMNSVTICLWLLQCCVENTMYDKTRPMASSFEFAGKCPKFGRIVMWQELSFLCQGTIRTTRFTAVCVSAFGYSDVVCHQLRNFSDYASHYLVICYWQYLGNPTRQRGGGTQVLTAVWDIHHPYRLWFESLERA